MTRLRHLVIGLALLATACGGGTGGIQVINPDGAAVDGMALAYGLDPGQRIAYDLDMTMDMDMDLTAPGMSGEAKMALDVGGLAKYAVGPGTEPGTVAVTMRASIENLDFREFTMDGQSLLGVMSEEDLLAEMGGADLLPEITVLLDERGNVLGVNGGDAFSADFLSGFGGGLGPSQSSLGRESFFGPPFPDEQLGVGSQWTVEDRFDVAPLGNLDVTSTYVVTGRENLAGRDVFVIKSDVATSELKIDLADLFKSLLDASEGDLAGFGLTNDGLQGGFEDMFAEIDGTIVMAPMRVTGTTWFDPAAGLIVRSSETAIVTMTMDMTMPGMGFAATDISATIGYELNLIDSRKTA